MYLKEKRNNLKEKGGIAQLNYQTSKDHKKHRTTLKVKNINISTQHK